jgi:hypothetical protein
MSRVVLGHLSGHVRLNPLHQLALASPGQRKVLHAKECASYALLEFRQARGTNCATGRVVVGRFDQAVFHLTNCSGPGEDERLDVAVTGPHFVFHQAGDNCDPSGPYFVPLAGRGLSGGRMPGFTSKLYCCGWVRLQVVVPGGVLVASIVGCDDGYAVRVRHPRTATVRGAPDSAPVVVRMTAGTPPMIPAKVRLPPVSRLMSSSRWCAVGRKRTAPTFVVANARTTR